jgi:hypothetical protein
MQALAAERFDVMAYRGQSKTTICANASSGRAP